MGIPFDSGISNRPGARSGPRAMREQSLQISAYSTMYPWDYNVAEKCRIVGYGDAVGNRIGVGITDAMIDAQYAMAKHVFGAGASLLVLGGDHTGTYGPMRAAAQLYIRTISEPESARKYNIFYANKR